MAVTPVTAELLVLNTRSTDFINTGSGTLNNITGNTTDGWEVQPPAGEILGERLFFRLVADGGGTVDVVFKAGDRYPAQRADLGDMTITLAASDERFISVETSRFLQDDGKMIIVPADAGTILTALIVPKAG
jgi:hypothetical protein